MATRKASSRPADLPLSIRLEPSLRKAVDLQAKTSGKPVSRVIRELLDMALRVQRFPGITFVQGPAGRRAHLAGTGLDVWEVIELLREYGSEKALRKHFPRLSSLMIRLARAYADAYPKEIGELIALNARAPGQVKQQMPWAEVVRV